MKKVKIKESEVRGLKIFCFLTAAVVDILCILYLLNVMQNHWLLNFIQILGVLLHISIALYAFVKNYRLAVIPPLLLAAVYLGSLIYYLM